MKQSGDFFFWFLATLKSLKTSRLSNKLTARKKSSSSEADKDSFLCALILCLRRRRRSEGAATFTIST